MLSNSLFKLMIYVNLLPNLLLLSIMRKSQQHSNIDLLKIKKSISSVYFHIHALVFLKAWPFRIPPEILESAHWSDRAC